MAGVLTLPMMSQAAFRYFDPTDTIGIPQLLSQTGLYTDNARTQLDTSAKYFDINAPLWSDGAVKKRWILLPRGRHIPYVDTEDVLDFPDSTVFVKTFWLEKVPKDSGTRVKWETRLLINKTDYANPNAGPNGRDTWYGFSYRWKSDTSDAILVSRDKGFDTTFRYFPNGTSRAMGYKKWDFPSQQSCVRCHRSGEGLDDRNLPTFARSVLGFLPVQLKKSAPLQGGINQITWLFNQGVFSGNPPTALQLATRWKNIGDPLPNTLTSAERFSTMDTMARSYFGSNCSGCHGTRGLSTGAIGRGPNYDFFRLRPQIEFGMFPTSSFSLNDTNWDTSTGAEIVARRKFLVYAGKAGMDTAHGHVWDMSLPAGNPNDLQPALVYPGYPALSTILFRQVARNDPWADSSRLNRTLLQNDPSHRASWIFSEPWGSPAWENLVQQHGLNIDSVITYDWDGDQMPPIASFIPDTTALKILGEWVKTYRTLVIVDTSHVFASIKNQVSHVATPAPLIREGILFVPGWEGNAYMIGITGRIHRLNPAGKNRYVIPLEVSRGVYFFKVGSHHFKSTFLR